MIKLALEESTVLVLNGARARRGVPRPAIDSALCEFFASPTVQLRHYKTGKPFLAGTIANGWHVSLSHCYGSTAIALAPKPIGVDIEELFNQPIAAEIAVLFYPPEIAWLDNPLRQNDYATNVTRFWTAKEALAKLSGRMLGNNDLPDLSQFMSPDNHAWDCRKTQLHLNSQTVSIAGLEVLLTLAEVR